MSIEKAATGDINGDGFVDLIGSDIFDENEVHLYYGSANGLGEASSWSAARFAYQAIPVFSGADYDGDGYDDLIEGPGTSSVLAYMWRGSSTGLPPSYTFFFPNPEGLGNTHKVARVRHGDFNADALADAALNSGVIESTFIYMGKASGLSRTHSDEVTDLVSSTSGRLNTSIVDHNGDFLDDLFIGLSTSKIHSTGALVSHTAGAMLFPDSPTTQYVNYSGAPTDNLGGETASGQLLIDDPQPEIVVGVPGARPGGRVYVFRSRNISSGPVVDIPNPTGEGLLSFGYSMSVPGDFEGDGYDDLVLADTRHDETGIVYIYSGPLTAATTAPSLSIAPPADAALNNFGSVLP